MGWLHSTDNDRGSVMVKKRARLTLSGDKEDTGVGGADGPPFSGSVVG